ncbi:hypothetical protein I316_07650 [Kwoniella heveanensis BCC8398]|uniref:Uncharacterized protein n=1 Tax=Kwoniella heveanensis BCC8398 TaxID=1296120 RepID=A0A1B9GI44_9TREE|nr:hypothetical protein I316_07650 [Kwoniella heveanensis BCC8398]
MSDTDTTIVLITGANTGIGYQTVLALLQSTKNEQRGYTILLGARSEAKAIDAIAKLKAEVSYSSTIHKRMSDLIPIAVDLDSDESIAHAFDSVRDKVDRIDVLINNAGVELDVFGLQKGLSTRQIFIRPYLFDQPSFDLSLDPNFILNRSPLAGWPKPPQREMWAYKSSKVALNMIMRDWHRLLKNDGVKVWCVNPGFVVTGLGGESETLRQMGAGDPSVSGLTVRSIVEGERDDETGLTVQKDAPPYGVVQPW